MKKKVMLIALSLALLSSCSFKDALSPLEHTKEGAETIINAVADITKDKTLGERLEDPDADIDKIANDFLKNNYKSPETMLEKFLVESVDNSGADEKEALVGLLGHLQAVYQEKGISIESLPIYLAIEPEAYEMANSLKINGNNEADIGLEYIDTPIKDFNIFIDPEVSRQYRDITNTSNLYDYAFMHRKYSHTENDPLLKEILYYSGEYGFQMEERKYPGGIKVYNSIGRDATGVFCYFSYVTTEDTHPAFNEHASEMKVVPISYLYIPVPDLLNPNYDPNDIVDEMEVLHLVTGPGLAL